MSTVHALTDRDCRPIAFLLTGGNVADCTAGHDLLKQLPDARILHADKGYDSNAIRQQVEANGTMPNIPPKLNRRWKGTFSRVVYRARNAIERMFCRLKDFLGASPPDTTASPSISSPRSTSPRSPASGYESGP
ncbi:hypothetical protein BLTE_07370 [Blastochloris tepida]|uniref:Transposase IS4-like domain-containing protein n=1 Tax=Blastochloris tepida TaxID=2233851 RepID=A0A348FXL9_9HYPH|nr:hypothetical protein BLTE_07370 [Blastochloris tepida]